MNNLQLVAMQERCEGQSTALIASIYEGLEEQGRTHPDLKDRLLKEFASHESIFQKAYRAGFYAGRKDAFRELGHE